MMVVWNKAALFDPSRGNVSAWIFTIARNLRVSAYRKQNRPEFDPNDPAFVPEDVMPATRNWKAARGRPVAQGHAAIAQGTTRFVTAFVFSRDPSQRACQGIRPAARNREIKDQEWLSQNSVPLWTIAKRGPLMSVHHHVSDELLLDYANGSLSEGWSIAVATHLALCPHCRKRLSAMEATAGAMIESLELEPAQASDADTSWQAMRPGLRRIKSATKARVLLTTQLRRPPNLLKFRFWRNHCAPILVRTSMV